MASMSRPYRPGEGLELEVSRLPPVERNYPVRLVPGARIFLAVLDDVAGVRFPSVDGEVDMEAMLLLTDPSGHRWASDLFAQEWSEASERQGPPVTVNRERQAGLQSRTDAARGATPGLQRGSTRAG